MSEKYNIEELIVRFLQQDIHNKQINCRTSKSDCLCTKFRPFKNRIGKWLRHFPIQDLFLIS